ncbi:hypothetical protein AJ80_02187 [Polytolypa hystricis UAMH7299]|uniref:Pinin/SDK/MemA protein domain-containing protein n=1 Tax=Polytolypa hystricis (strain UAMH7299) TaxID=1447883 RepID=A0A2B7YT07_POLH7|nr:hypothetical protein AJ80_02187 [Polytolypa hystricis UAMH7299]
MAEGAIASAVALPEPEDSPAPGLKRRQSSISDSDSKRRRLSSETNNDTRTKDHQHSHTSIESNTVSGPANNNSTAADAQPGRRRTGGAEEERKRGQRLFGALLGTLSQRSSSAAQKRRADIEKKQQAKLKLQDEEYTELTRKKQEDLLALRRTEQKSYDRESMELRHSNMLALARFLKTKTEPVLYYKPWELRPEDEDTIHKQIEEAKTIVAKEVAEFERNNPPEAAKESLEAVPDKPLDTTSAAEPANTDGGPLEPSSSSNQEMTDTVGATDTTTNDNDDHEPATKTDPQPDAAVADSSTTNEIPAPTKSEGEPAVSKAHEDDSGDVMLEDKEDTVIY